MLKSPGIERVDRFVFDAGKYSFKARNGVNLTVNEQTAMSHPQAYISEPIVSLLAEQLKTRFELDIEVELLHRGFIYRFTSPAQHERLVQPKPIEIDIEAVKKYLLLAPLCRGTPPKSMMECIDTTGPEVIKWLLQGICDGAPFKYTLNGERVLWTPR